MNDATQLASIRTILLAITAGMSLIGLPLLVTLLSRVQDVRSKLLEKRTPKAIKDEIAALEELATREREAMAAQQRALSSQLQGVRPTIVPVGKDVERVATEMGDLAFYLGGKGRKLYQRVANILNMPRVPEAAAHLPDCPDLLAGYRESLARQSALIEEAKSSREWVYRP